MLALIDGDLVAYINAASAENDPEEIALLRTDKFVRDILEVTKADSYRLFLSGAGNFRYEVDPEYKANRRDMQEPRYREACKLFLVREWNAEVTDGYEADDSLGIHQDKKGIWDMRLDDRVADVIWGTTICTIDKDLDMIPGMHYRWPIVRGGKIVTEGKLYEVSELEGLRSFYRSLLVGDRTDNITGVDGIGKVKAARHIDHLRTEEEMLSAVRDLYCDDDRLLKNGKLLWIMREEGVQWTFPQE